MLTAAWVLTLVAAGLYLTYEAFALVSNRVRTISAIVRSWEVHWQIPFLLACGLWVAFGIWFSIHIVFNCCP